MLNELPLPKVMDEKILAYAAGFFDGEGCINFTTRGKYKHKSNLIRVMVVNTNKEVLEHLKSFFGGRIEYRKTRSNWKDSYCWRLDQSSAVSFLISIYPYVIIKKEQIDISIVWEMTRNKRYGKRLEDYDLETENLLINQLKFINKKGPKSLEPDPITLCIKSTGYSFDTIMENIDYASG